MNRAKMAKMAIISGTGTMRISVSASQTPLLAAGELSAHGSSVRAPRLARRSSRRACRAICR